MLFFSSVFGLAGYSYPLSPQIGLNREIEVLVDDVKIKCFNLLLCSMGWCISLPGICFERKSREGVKMGGGQRSIWRKGTWSRTRSLSTYEDSHVLACDIYINHNVA